MFDISWVVFWSVLMLAIDLIGVACSLVDLLCSDNKIGRNTLFTLFSFYHKTHDIYITALKHFFTSAQQCFAFFTGLAASSSASSSACAFFTNAASPQVSPTAASPGALDLGSRLARAPIVVLGGREIACDRLARPQWKDGVVNTEEATTVYDDATIKLRGGKAMSNFPYNKVGPASANSNNYSTRDNSSSDNPFSSPTFVLRYSSDPTPFDFLNFSKVDSFSLSVDPPLHFLELYLSSGEQTTVDKEFAEFDADDFLIFELV
ncbi:hypothetical protein ZIOFF_073358 [Zingiber officinale]|uniref:Uncharacterized protein n=1 Tax=Zingiber officinale TaxID=94328 RepID=A0A8J5BYH0_ZINOF|nr:hypothetical protein ZIOFF_073358 [Zingiber officinale]